MNNVLGMAKEADKHGVLGIPVVPQKRGESHPVPSQEVGIRRGEEDDGTGPRGNENPGLARRKPSISRRSLAR